MSVGTAPAADSTGRPEQIVTVGDTFTTGIKTSVSLHTHLLSHFPVSVGGAFGEDAIVELIPHGLRDKVRVN